MKERIRKGTSRLKNDASKKRRRTESRVEARVREYALTTHTDSVTSISRLSDIWERPTITADWREGNGGQPASWNERDSKLGLLAEEM